MLNAELDIIDWTEKDPIVHGIGSFDYDPSTDNGGFVKAIAERIKTVDAEVSIKYSLTLKNKYLRRTLSREFVSSAPIYIVEKEVKRHLDKCLEEYRNS